MQYVFVYGTLRKGERASGILDDCRYVGLASISNGVTQLNDTALGEPISVAPLLLTLPGHDHYPAVVTVRDAEARENNLRIPDQRIRGEVYQIPDQPPERREEIRRRLDQYEGYPRLYGRTQVMAFLDDGTPIRAHIYYMVLSPAHLTDFRVITSGDWKDRAQSVPYLEYTSQEYDHGDRRVHGQDRDIFDYDRMNRIRRPGDGGGVRWHAIRAALDEAPPGLEVEEEQDDDDFELGMQEG